MLRVLTVLGLCSCALDAPEPTPDAGTSAYVAECNTATVTPYKGELALCSADTACVYDDYRAPACRAFCATEGPACPPNMWWQTTVVSARIHPDDPRDHRTHFVSVCYCEPTPLNR